MFEGARRPFGVGHERRRRRTVLLRLGQRRVLGGGRDDVLLVQRGDIQFAFRLVQFRVRLAGGDAAQVLGRFNQRIRIVVRVGEFWRYEGQHQLLVD